MKAILVISLFICFSSHAQQNSVYVVKYLTTVSSILSDSIKENIVNKLPDIPDLGTVTINWPEIKIEATFFMVASKKSSKMFLDSIISIEGGVGHINMPDTNYFSDGKWSKLEDGKISDIDPKSFDFIKTKETKLILGFQCVKYEAFDGKLIIWASDQLPTTLIPFVGLTRFNHAILELIDHTTNTKIISTSINKF